MYLWHPILERKIKEDEKKFEIEKKREVPICL